MSGDDSEGTWSCEVEAGMKCWDTDVIERFKAGDGYSMSLAESFLNQMGDEGRIPEGMYNITVVWG